MTDDTPLDRRRFLRRVGTAVTGAIGVVGTQSVRGARRNPGQSETGQEGGVREFELVLPDVEPLETGYLHTAVVVGSPRDSDEGPPQACVGDGEWRAYDAAIADLTELSWFGGDEDSLGNVVRARAYAARPVRLGTPYRVVEGDPCDGHVRVTVHKLADEIEGNIDVNESGDSEN